MQKAKQPSGRASDKRSKKFSTRLLAILFWLALWALVAWAIHRPLLFPGPLRVLERFFALPGQADFFLRLGTSFWRITWGFFLGLGLGLGLALLLWKWPTWKPFALVPVRLMQTIPLASFILIALFYLASDQLPIFIAFLVVFPPIFSNALEGLEAVEVGQAEVAKVFHFSPLHAIQLLYLPSLAPYLEAAWKVALSMAWKAGVAAEILALSRTSIGQALYEAKIYLEMDQLFSWTLWLLVLSRLGEGAFILLWRAFLRFWKKARFRPKRPRPKEAQGKKEPIHLEVEDLQLSFDQKKVLGGLTFSLQEGDRVLFYGPSGQGKTSLFRFLAGLIPSDGKKVQTLLPASVAFQDHRLFGDFSAKQNLSVTGASEEEMAEALEAVGLAEAGEKVVANFSGGMQARLGLVRALLFPAPLLLLDEPTASLDPKTKDRLQAFLRKALDQRGGITLIASHDPGEVCALGANRVFYLEEKGRLQERDPSSFSIKEE